MLGIGSLIGAVPACNWSVSGPAAAPAVAATGGEPNAATVGAQLANVFHPVAVVAPSITLVHPVASHAMAASPPSLSWIEPARRASKPFTCVAKSDAERPEVLSGFHAKPRRPVLDAS